MRAKKRGGRTRFNGGHFGDTPQDRAVADWIDQQPNAWAAIKFLLYQHITGGAVNWQAPRVETTDNDTIGEAGNALLEMDI